MDLVELVAIIAGIIASSLAIIAVPVYFWRKHGEKIRSLQNLCHELNYNLKGLGTVKHTGDVILVKIHVSAEYAKTAYFINRYLNHDFYDSLISSGTIYFLDQDIQQLIQNVFRLIKTHNSYLETAMRMLRKPQPVTEEIWPYAE